MGSGGAEDGAAIRFADTVFAWKGAPRFCIAVPDLVIGRGERVLLLGESGSGKSTLLSLICGINTADGGRVEVAGQDIAALRGGRRDRFRAETIGVIFQMFNLLPYASPLDNILLPLQFAPERRRRCPDPRAEALRIGTALGLSQALLERGRAAALSTGQQQRVAVARALIGGPPIILADEPTSALDAGAQAAFLELLFEQVTAAEATLVMVSHDPRLAAGFDRRIDLADVAEISQEAA